MQKVSILKAIQLLILLFLIFGGLYYAKSFLIPITFAAIFSMLVAPVTIWLESKGMNRAIAVIISILCIVFVVAGISWLIAWQVSDLLKDAASIEQNLTKKISEVKSYISNSLGISPEKQAELSSKQSQSSGLANSVGKILGGVGGLLTNFLLVSVYIFLLLYFRTHLKKFVLQLTPKENAVKTEQVIEKCRTVAQKYLSGLGLMIVGLWIMYSIGFSVAGVKSPIFFAILCGLLEIVPFVGNLAGTAITLLMSIAQGGSTNVIIGILITYGLVQFIQSYVLEPLVVGAEVNINPLFTIIGIVVGELVWGIPGMILAIPLLGIIKIICDNVPNLKPYGFLLGVEKERKKNSGK